MLLKILATLGLTAGLLAAGSADKAEVVKRVEMANEVLQEIMTAPDQGIPEDLLRDANCVVVVPGLKRGGFIVAAEYGKGVMTCRVPDGTGWSGPSTIRMEGGSVGFQIGASETDVVMLVMNKGGADKLMTSEFTLGGDASVAAGPVGRSATAETDAMMHAKILSYSRSRGVFAGVALDGATLRSDDDDNQKLYGRPVTHRQILEGNVKAPAAAAGLRQTLSKYSPREG